MNDRKTNFAEIPEDIINKTGSMLPTLNDKFNYAFTCKTIHKFFQPVLDQHLLKDLLQAITNDGCWNKIDKDNKISYIDNKITVKKILNARPWLLLEIPQKNTMIERITNIAPGGTQILQANKSPFATALILGNINMVKLMLPYLNQIKNGKEKALEQWKAPLDEKKKTYNGFIEKLLCIIRQEAVDAPISFEKSKTSEMLATFSLELKGSTHPIMLENFLDGAQLLITGYQATYNDLNEQQISMYAYIISMVKNTLPKETYEFFTKKKAYMDATEIIHNKSLCNEFTSFIEKRQAHLEEIKNMLILEVFYNFLQKEYLPIASNIKI